MRICAHPAAVSQQLDELDRETLRCRETGTVAIDEPKGTLDGATEPDRLFEHRIEHRREIARRGIDDLQYLRSRRLLFERLACLGDQPGVFHRNHGLRGEILQESNLLVRERSNFMAIGGDVT